MLEDLRNDLATKQAELTDMQMSYREVELPEEWLQSMKHDIQMMIGMLDDEMQNPQLMNEYIRKFVSSITVHRETKRAQDAYGGLSVGQCQWIVGLLANYSVTATINNRQENLIIGDETRKEGMRQTSI